MKHNLVTLLQVIGRKESLFEKMSKEVFISRMDQCPFLTISQSKLVNEMVTKITRFLANKSRYKYRSKVHIQSEFIPQIRFDTVECCGLRPEEEGEVSAGEVTTQLRGG
jgi:hypothetical protein